MSEPRLLCGSVTPQYAPHPQGGEREGDTKKTSTSSATQSRVRTGRLLLGVLIHRALAPYRHSNKLRFPDNPVLFSPLYSGLKDLPFPQAVPGGGKKDCDVNEEMRLISPSASQTKLINTPRNEISVLGFGLDGSTVSDF